MFMLHLALISGLALGSVPDNALARAPLNQVLENGAFGKFCATLMVPADASVAVLSVQPSASQLARIVIVGPLFSVAPQIFAAVWAAFIRCWPRVVPAFPPTGATGVVSLKPTPGASLFKITTVDCADADDDATRLTATMTRKMESFTRTCLFIDWITDRFFDCGPVGFKQLWIDFVESRRRSRIVDAGL
jgi:hypothetical protein